MFSILILTDCTCSTWKKIYFEGFLFTKALQIWPHITADQSKIQGRYLFTYHATCRWLFVIRSILRGGMCPIVSIIQVIWRYDRHRCYATYVFQCLFPLTFEPSRFPNKDKQTHKSTNTPAYSCYCDFAVYIAYTVIATV